MLPPDVMAKARLHPERRLALEAHVTPKNGGRMVEVGTMTGNLAKYLIRTFKPKELTVMDVDGWAIGQCRGRTSEVAREMNANTSVTCLLGDSKRKLENLEDNAYDLIYIDGAHDYLGACGDAEAARKKVKVGGLLAFNDYYVFEWGFLAMKGRWGVYGIVHAVNEFVICYKSDWELVYYTFGPGGTDGGGLKK